MKPEYMTTENELVTDMKAKRNEARNTDNEECLPVKKVTLYAVDTKA